MEDLILNCGNCAWYRKIEIPREKEKEISPRGYCYVNPPSVFPFPQQAQSSLAVAGGQPAPGKTTMIPIMQRAVVEEKEDICGQYSPNKEMGEELLRRQDCENKASCEECNCVQNVVESI